MKFEKSLIMRCRQKNALNPFWKKKKKKKEKQYHLGRPNIFSIFLIKKQIISSL